MLEDEANFPGEIDLLDMGINLEDTFLTIIFCFLLISGTSAD
jgi:hypothetical protein